MASWLDDAPGATLTLTIVDDRKVSFISWLAPYARPPATIAASRMSHLARQIAPAPSGLRWVGGGSCTGSRRRCSRPNLTG